jgi:hypothetical protein
VIIYDNYVYDSSINCSFEYTFFLTLYVSYRLFSNLTFIFLDTRAEMSAAYFLENFGAHFKNGTLFEMNSSENLKERLRGIVCKKRKC